MTKTTGNPVERLTPLAGGLAVVLMAGCSVTPRVGPQSPPPGPGQAYVVMGLQPQGAIVQWRRGTLQNDRFIATDSDLADVVMHANGGYAIAQFKSGQHYALTQIFAGGKGVVEACGGTQVPVVFAQEGAVLYAGDFKLEPAEWGVRYAITSDVAGAARHVDAVYPKLAGQVEMRVARAMPIDNPCVRTIIVREPAATTKRKK